MKVEAINHAKAANVPLIVAINNIDKPGANPDRVKQELADQGLLVEDWGGEVISVPVSALKGEGIDTLLEMVLLVAEMEELKANPNKRAVGTVIEAELDKGRGPVATVLVQGGTLRVGDPIVAGVASGKVRAMINSKGKRVKVAGPSTAVEILGLSEVPQGGDQVVAVPNDKAARVIAEKRQQMAREEMLKSNQRMSLDDFFSQMGDAEVKDLNIVIKADVQGSVQAVKQSLEKLSNEEVAVRVIHGGVGAVTESDIMLATASNAIIIGFNVRPVPSAEILAKKEGVDVRTYTIIYKAIEDVQAAMTGMLDPEYIDEDTGKAEVRETFKLSGVGTIAGCYVTSGKVFRGSKVRIVRDGIIIHEGQLAALKRFKDDAKEVNYGYECGMSFVNYNDVKEGDIIEAYITKVEILGLSEVPQGGDQVVAVPNDKAARVVAEKRQQMAREEMLKSNQRMSLDDFFSQMGDAEVKDLNIVIKADVQGSVQAVKQSLEKLSNEEVAVRVIHGGVGAVTESDIMLATASNAIIIGFNVRPVPSAEILAKKEGVDVRTYTIIYKAIEDVQAAMTGMLDPEFRDEDTGKAEVREIFKLSGVGTIAGCYVTSGKVFRGSKVRIVRDGIIIHEGQLAALRRFKDDVKEVNYGYECGMTFINYNDVKEGDIIEAYITKEVERKLK